jgi:hypothetical protein
MMRLSDILFAAGAISITTMGAVEAVPDLTPHPCTLQEACAPLPITLGDEPGRDGPQGPVGPSGATTGSTLSGATGATGPAYRT